MKMVLQIIMFFSWGLWLLYSYLVLFSRKAKPDRNLLIMTVIALAVLILLLRSRMMIGFSAAALLFILAGMFRKPARGHTLAEAPLPLESRLLSWWQILPGMALATIVLFSLFFLLGYDYQSESNYFVEKYLYHIPPQQKNMVIGNSKELTQVTVENKAADRAHLQLTLNPANFYVKNTSVTKKVDVNGRYLNKLVLRPGDEVEINGKEKIKVLSLNRQYPLGRSLRVAIRRPGQEQAKVMTLHTLLNKGLVVQYGKTGPSGIAVGLNRLLLRGAEDEPLAVIAYEPHRFFLGMNIYYLIVIYTVLLLSIGLYLYLKNRFNGGLLLLFMVSLPFMAGFVSLFLQVVLILGSLPFIIYIQRRRKIAWNWGAALLSLLFGAIFIFPLLMRMEGDFTLQHYEFSRKDSLRITRGHETFRLKDLQKELAYNETHRIILGHTAYGMTVTREQLELAPLDPEKIKISEDFQAIICDLDQVTPGSDFIYLKYPHRFDPVPAAAAAGEQHLTIAGPDGNSIILSKIHNENYFFYLNGLVRYIVIPFWIFLLFGSSNKPFWPGIVAAGRRIFQKAPDRYRRSKRKTLFNGSNILVFQGVYLLLGLGYVVFGALALYNNSYFKNFAKYRSQALPLFVGLLLLFLWLSQYNRWLVFLYRVLKQKKFHVPLLVGLLVILPVNYSDLFLYAGILFLIFVFAFRLRKDLVYEFRNSRSYAPDIKSVIEKIICSFEEKTHRQILFGLGRVLNRQGWNYLLVSDLLLLLALFFIVLQLFLGGELGVSVAGFFFLPIELGKILLTIYFADWVSRIDRGMKLKVLWIYGLVLTPFVFLVVFLKDFSPLVVFSFVFLYHIIKIKKTWILKLFLAAFLGTTLVITVLALSRYTFPFSYFAILLSLPLLFLLLRLVRGKQVKRPLKFLWGSSLVILLAAIHYVAFFHTPAVPKTLAHRINSWLMPWQDYHLSYQYVNSLWLMKGTGAFGKSTSALAAAGHVPLIEKDLSFSLYISVLGTVGAAFIFFTIFMVAAYVHKMVRLYGGQGRSSPHRWYLYLMEFLVVIFLAQFLVPALYVVGLLPIMGQPLPFLSYSNNLLLLFALPFSFLMIAAGNNLAEKEPGDQGENG